MADQLADAVELRGFEHAVGTRLTLCDGVIRPAIGRVAPQAC
jgi:hypothetical protein